MVDRTGGTGLGPARQVGGECVRDGTETFVGEPVYGSAQDVRLGSFQPARGKWQVYPLG